MYLGANLRIRKLGLCAIAGILILVYFYSLRTASINLGEETISMKALLAGAIRAAEMGGLEIISVHNDMRLNIESKGRTKEGVNDPVTAADYKSHCAMYHALTAAFPKITVISEEESKECDKVNISDLKDSMKYLEDYNIEDTLVNVDDVTVWIDPLDATKEFTENLLQYVTTMVCIAVKKEPIIGVIHKPFESKSTYWAWVGHGLSSNLKNYISTEEVKIPVLIVSRSHAGLVQNASKLAFGENVQIISAAGAGYKALEIAAGNATAYVHMTAIKKWDICACAAIISALGGTMTSLSGPGRISFGTSDPIVLNSGLLATMRDHNWYLDKFSNV
ncbi:putative inositol monophosphatase 3 isoform X2 [Belonocnema kinseyi]|uniref:putative inositol monophosphatase 3 isoform X2 n=1 Tax=Belonocnema kinseyi TaxID=2817044 RepID=UPI00143D01DB|nr:putative inositol monophosphatase 3 isoform X2 [Belonocnema kinseyi]